MSMDRERPSARGSVPAGALSARLRGSGRRGARVGGECSMMMTKPSLHAARGLGLAGVIQAALVTAVSAQSVIEGTWLTVSKSEITIEACAPVHCGRISKIEVPPEIVAKYGDDLAALEGNFTDQLNKDPALRTRPILGLQILTLTPTENPWVYDGEIYNPQDGNTYSGYVEVLGADKLKLNGCVLYNIICQGEEWVRIITPPEPLVAPDLPPPPPRS